MPSEEHTALNFSSENTVQGTLYVLTSVLAFISTTGVGFEIQYPAITLHAISRGAPQPSIYCQLDESYGTENGAVDNDTITDMRELTIVPQNPASLDPIFEALSECAALHPDPKDEEDDLDDAFVDIDDSKFETFNGDENEELSEVGRAALAHLESIICDPHQLQPELEDENEHRESTDDTAETKEQSETKAE
ncbi:regulator of volume decrease after cellular swelling-domain-containing protein [Pholiota molesta]|nr:regulator of volume decrease after cellular swelling-domain-containing protein [Pholiota molesta]